jgi:electron transfer flavoprotein alpha subunit
MSQDIFVLIEHLRGEVSEISYIMLAAGRSLAGDLSSRVIAVLIGNKIEGLAANLAADQVWTMNHPDLADFNSDLYRQALRAILQEHPAGLVLFGDTSMGTEIAGPLSVQMNFPLVSACHSLSVQDGTVKFTCQVCGGKLMVEGKIPATTTFVTMMPGGYRPEDGQSEQPVTITQLEAPDFKAPRMILKQYIEPDTSDVDISKEELLVAVGRGIQNEDNLQLARDLADALGAVLCSSRPVVDQGWLPTSRLVGKSGHRVGPKVYLALGISGAPEHAEAITGSETIIAINTDPDAPIFEIAQYGAEIDLLDLLPVLTEKLRAIKVY